MRVNNRRSKLTQHDQSGVASIFVVMVLMTLLALISVGFSHLMNREVRQSQDRQLSAEAFYAAESGVNDARAYVSSGGGNSDGCPTPTSGPGSPFVINGNVSGDGKSKYTCVSINTTPKVLEYTIPKGQSIVVKIGGTDLNNMSRLYIGWENAKYTNLPPQPLGTFNQLPQQGSVGGDNTGLLRVAAYPLMSSCNNSAGDIANYNRYAAAVNSTDATIECASRNYFLYPNAAPNSDTDNVNFRNASVNGSSVSGKCTYPAVAPPTDISSQVTPRYCNSIINNMYPVTGTAGAITAKGYYLRLTAAYNDLAVSIQAVDITSGSAKALKIDNAEALIDVTGVGNDVLRRVQAIFPLQTNQSYNYGLQSMESVCKLFRVPVSGPGFYDQAYPNFGSYNTDNICAMPSGSNNIDPGGLPPIDINPPVPQCPSPPGSGPCAPPNCTATAGGYPAGGGLYFLTGGGGGCSYWFDDVVGWNGGFGAAGPVPSGTCHTNSGGVDPWGFLSSASWCAP